MTNRQNIITILRTPAIASDEQIVKYVPCPYTCADKHAPCAGNGFHLVLRGVSARMVKEARKGLNGVMQPRTVTSPWKCRVHRKEGEQ